MQHVQKKTPRIQLQPIIFAGILIMIGVIGRWVLTLPNVETLTAITLLAGVLLGSRWGLIVPLVTVAISDIVYGNDAIVLYTWSAWAIIGLSAALAKRRMPIVQAKPIRFSAQMTLLGILGSIFFFLWTNFGVWQLFNFYPKTLNGLMASYIAGLPFLKFSLLGNIIVVPVLSISLLWVFRKLCGQQKMPSIASLDYAHQPHEKK